MIFVKVDVIWICRIGPKCTRNSQIQNVILYVTLLIKVRLDKNSKYQFSQVLSLFILITKNLNFLHLSQVWFMHIQTDFNNLDYGIHNTENDSQNGKTNGKKWPYSACPCSFLFQDTFFQGCKTFWPWTFQPQGDGVRTATKKLHQKFFKYPFLGLSLNCHQLFKI